MKTIFVLAALFLAGCSKTTAPDFRGDWSGSITIDNQTRPLEMVLGDGGVYVEIDGVPRLTNPQKSTDYDLYTGVLVDGRWFYLLGSGTDGRMSGDVLPYGTGNWSVSRGR